MDVERRPGPQPFQDGVLRLAHEPRAPHLVPAEFRFIEWKAAPGRPLRGFGQRDPVVEARDEDPALGIGEAGNDPGEGEKRVGRRPPVESGVEVAGGAGDLDLRAHDAAQPERDRRDPGGKHPGIQHQRRVRAHALGVGPDVRLDRPAAALLFAFDQDLHIDRQGSPGGEVALDRFEKREDLPFVVGRPAGVEASAAPRGLERGRGPQVERVRGLHVVMAVGQHGGPSRGPAPLAIRERVPLAGNQTAVQPDRAKMIRGPAGRPLHVGSVGRERADAGDAQPLAQVPLELLGIRAGECEWGGHAGVVGQFEVDSD